MFRRSRRWRLVRTRAAVAVVVCEDAVLLAERARRAGDRWSGHIAFPGGRAEPGDRDAVDTAIRETREEVGLALAREQVVARLPTQLTLGHGTRRPMAVDPIVFHVEQRPALALNHEVVAAFWVPLTALRSGVCDARRPWRVGPVTLPMPAWEWQGHVIWGLTYAMLRKWMGRVE